MGHQEILDQLHLTTLRRLVREAGLTGVDRRSRRAMTAALLGVATIRTGDLLALRDAGRLAPLPARRPDEARPRCGPAAIPAAGALPAFLAIDFETADPQRDSACAVGLVRVQDGRIIDQASHLIRPPRREFWFTHIHGITYSMVKDSPTFGEIWPELAPWFRDVDFLVAHNASFDRSVLRACCERHALPVPALPFQCTVKLARRHWDIRPTTLPDVCSRLCIPLDHHEALSDARACARIMIHALREQGAGAGSA